MTNLIEVNNLTRAFGNKVALNNINFSIKRGEIFGFLGPSGSGKTTLVKILTAQLSASTGSINVFNKDVSHLHHPSEMKRIGILTDNSGLYEKLTIYDNLLLFTQLYDLEISRIEEVLKDVNLLDDKKTVVEKLSKGMKQRVTLARALLHKPELLFLDEPTSALDPANKKQIHEALKKLNEAGTTIFLSTHDMEEAETLCDRLAFLFNGDIIEVNTPQNIRVMHSDNTMSLSLTSGEAITVTRDEAGVNAVLNYFKKNEVVTIHSNEPTLGEIFIKLTGRAL